jgi:hypothetical protein
MPRAADFDIGSSLAPDFTATSISAIEEPQQGGSLLAPLGIKKIHLARLATQREWRMTV